MALSVVDCWTDGSGTTLGYPGGWAYVLETVHPVTGQCHRKEGSGGAQDTTNNRMEMTACLMGLRALRRSTIVVVHTDSEYLMKPFTEGWLNTWYQKNTIHKKKNADLWTLLREQVNRHMVTWEWVKGHSKIELNERCDLLAGQERRRILEGGLTDREAAKATQPRQGQLAVDS